MTGKSIFVSLQSAERGTCLHSPDMSNSAMAQLNKMLSGHFAHKHVIRSNKVGIEVLKFAIEQNKWNVVRNQAQRLSVLLTGSDEEHIDPAPHHEHYLFLFELRVVIRRRDHESKAFPSYYCGDA